MKNRNPLVLPMTLHTKKQVFHDKRDPKGGSKNDQSELLSEVDEHECLLVIPNTFTMCGEDGNYCSEECLNRSKK